MKVRDTMKQLATQSLIFLVAMTIVASTFAQSPGSATRQRRTDNAPPATGNAKQVSDDKSSDPKSADSNISDTITADIKETEAKPADAKSSNNGSSDNKPADLRTSDP